MHQHAKNVTAVQQKLYKDPDNLNISCDLYSLWVDYCVQISSGQCPDRSRGTDTDLKALLRELYPVLVMNIATNNVMGGKIDVSQALQNFWMETHAILNPELLDGGQAPKTNKLPLQLHTS